MACFLFKVMDIVRSVGNSTMRMMDGEEAGAQVSEISHLLDEKMELVKRVRNSVDW